MLDSFQYLTKKMSRSPKSLGKKGAFVHYCRKMSSICDASSGSGSDAFRIRISLSIICGANQQCQKHAALSLYPRRVEGLGRAMLQ